MERFERIMRECEVEADEWVDKLFSRLNEKLCVRVSALKDEGAGYEAIKGALLNGHRIFELNGEALKAKTGDEIVDLIGRNCRGLFQNSKSVEDCVFALAIAITRQVIPSGGRVSWKIRL